ncbi:MAG TPA: hypothetical protein VEA69_06890 [Tepidisphaeraceae bacterium]|nr:hypothetical protein [Tepidisphaeraceae bacterium]
MATQTLQYVRDAAVPNPFLGYRRIGGWLLVVGGAAFAVAIVGMNVVSRAGMAQSGLMSGMIIAMLGAFVVAMIGALGYLAPRRIAAHLEQCRADVRDGRQLAVWEYDDAEWAAFTAHQGKLSVQGEEELGCVTILMVAAPVLILAGTLIFSDRSGRSWAGAVGMTVLAEAALLLYAGLVALNARGERRARAKATKGRTVLTRGAAWVADEILFWGPGWALTDVRLAGGAIDGDGSPLRIVLTRKGGQGEFISEIPVPFGKQGEAEEAVRALKGQVRVEGA